MKEGRELVSGINIEIQIKNDNQLTSFALSYSHSSLSSCSSLESIPIFQDRHPSIVYLTIPMAEPVD